MLCPSLAVTPYPSDSAKRIFCLRFILGVKEKIVREILSVEGLINAPQEALSTASAYPAHLSRYCLQALHDVDDIKCQDALNDMFDRQISLLSLNDDDYPELLKQTYDPPLLLFYRGDISLLNTPQLAVVGGRKASRQGLLDAEKFANELAASGFTVTSGMALGIDGAAHQGALDTHGRTIAVLGAGVDVCYPLRHRGLMERIIENGLIISEYPCGRAALAGQFPRRNRIVTGMSLGVLVIEAGLKSGSLISARLAMEQGREVFALPGSIHNPMAKGCHHLIKQGAVLTESVDDILTELKGWTNSNKDLQQVTELAMRNIADLPKSLKAILNIIGYEMLSLPDIHAELNVPIAELMADLMELELLGLLVNQNGKYQYLTK